MNSYFKEKQIVDSWNINASPWIEAIEKQQIGSRIRVTDRAICDAITNLKPKTVLDLGCGEGWLVRYLVSRNIEAIGIDSSLQLIAKAKQLGQGEYHHLEYKDLVWQMGDRSFDAIVANFSLFGEQVVEVLLKSVSGKLNSSGSFVMQTLHPKIACENFPYEDGWRNGSWSGFSQNFTKPAPWYFRTLESWRSLITSCGMELVKIIEPIDPMTGKMASVIFIAQNSL